MTARNASAIGVRSGLSPVVVIGLPGAPTGVGRKAGARGSVTVFWKAAPANGSKILAYNVTTYFATGGMRVSSVRGNVKSIVVKGLAPGRTYSFAVAARNAAGVSPKSKRSKPITIK